MNDQIREVKIGNKGGHAVGCTMKTLLLVVWEDMYPTTMELLDFDYECYIHISVGIAQCLLNCCGE